MQHLQFYSPSGQIKKAGRIEPLLFSFISLFVDSAKIKKEVPDIIQYGMRSIIFDKEAFGILGLLRVLAAQAVDARHGVADLIFKLNEAGLDRYDLKTKPIMVFDEFDVHEESENELHILDRERTYQSIISFDRQTPVSFSLTRTCCPARKIICTLPGLWLPILRGRRYFLYKKQRSRTSRSADSGRKKVNAHDKDNMAKRIAAYMANR